MVLLFGQCLAFRSLFYLFHGLAWANIGLSTFLFLTYLKTGQNMLLKSLCLVMMTSILVIEFPFLMLGREPYNYDWYNEISIVQAILLNYCFISTQAHVATMMMNNCLLALGWRFGQWGEVFDRPMFFLLISYGIPIIPTVILVRLIPGHIDSISYSFYSFVPASLMFKCCTSWLLLCAVPGNLATVYLMWKMMSLRNQTLQMTAHSQITKFQVFRLFSAMLIYSLMSLGSSVPLLFMDAAQYIRPQNFLGSSALKSPWSNPGLCSPLAGEDPRLLYYYRIRCPGIMAFWPVIVGFGIFIMYGFGTPVREAFRQLHVLLNRAVCKRRTSSPQALDTEHETEMTMTEALSCVPQHDDDEMAPKAGLNSRRRKSSGL